MARRRLVWKLYATYLVVILLCIGGVGGYALRSVRAFYLDQTAADLETRARLVAGQLSGGAALAEAARVHALLKAQGKATATRFTVIDAAGKVLGDSDYDPAGMDSHADRPEVKTALAGAVGRRTRYGWTLKVEGMYVAVPLTQDGRVVAVVRAELIQPQINAALDRIYYAVALGALAVTLIAAALGMVVSRRISRPLKEMAAGARRFAQGDLAHKLLVPNTAEVADLAETLNRMAAELDSKIRAVTRQKNEQEAILASMTEGVVAVDTEERVISLNQAAAALLGTTAGEAVGRSLEEVVRNVDLAHFVSKVMADEPSAEAQVVIRRGGDRLIQARGTPLTGAASRNIGALIVLNDVTRLQRLETVRRDFVANVSHELKTPITAIKGFVETLREGAVADPEKAARFLDILARQADRLSAIVDDLLDLSRIERQAERHEVERYETDLKGVLESAVAACETRSAERGVPVRLTCPEDLRLRLNPQLIEQAVVNLLDNAIKYSERGTAADLEVEQSGGAVLIRVRDRGCGIPAEHLPRIFERFYRVDKARSRELGGTGLGLSIVKHIVQAHSATITVESAVGQGSTFTIHLPVA